MTREIPRGATICRHGVEPYDCKICFPKEEKEDGERRTEPEGKQGLPDK